MLLVLKPNFLSPNTSAFFLYHSCCCTCLAYFVLSLIVPILILPIEELVLVPVRLHLVASNKSSNYCRLFFFNKSLVDSPKKKFRDGQSRAYAATQQCHRGPRCLCLCALPPIMCKVASSHWLLHAHDMAVAPPGLMSQIQARIRGRATLFIQEDKLFPEVPLHLIDQNCNHSHHLLQENEGKWYC